MIRYQSGMPVNITSNGNLFGLNIGGNGGQFPNLVGNPYAGANSAPIAQSGGLRSSGGWPVGQSRPQLYPLAGDQQRGHGPDEELQLHGSARKCTFRFEVFNLLNHPEVWGINTSFNGDNPGGGLSASSGQFGQANAFRDARTIQLALRFAF